MIAAYPGSFDPLHLGHLAIVERAAAGFDEVVVLVLGNPAKSHLLPLPRRVELVATSTAHLPNVRAVGHEGLTVDGARAQGADVIVRNVGKEVDQERTMAVMNEGASGLPTVLVRPDPALVGISSTLVRALVANGRHEDVRPLVPAPVYEALAADPEGRESS